MPQVLTHAFAELRTPAAHGIAPTSEDALRVGAATLCRASAAADMVTATRVVVQVGADDVDALERVARAIADEHALDVAVRLHVGWCAVRFARRGRAPG
jgi:hypothetical protein